MRLKHYNKVKSEFKKAAQGNLTDHRIGISFAIGTLFAVLPISVASIAICIFLALIFKYLNKISLFLALLVWNPLWHIIFFYPARKIGKYLLQSHMDSITTFFGSIPYAEKIIQFGIFYATGMIVIAIYMSILSYFVVRLLVKLYRLREIKASQ